jgi:BlaI family penicillinase repressor
MRQKAKVLTEQELEIMKAVWETGPAKVRDVYERLRKKRQVAYTTVMTMMNILVDKKHLKKKTVGRVFHYEPTRPKEKVVSAMVQDFVGRVFDGSAQPLLLHLVEDRRLSESDLKEIEQLIEEKLK